MNTNMKTLLATALAWSPMAAWAGDAATAEVDVRRPEAVVEASAECGRREDWMCMGRLIDPAALRELRQFLAATVGARLLGVEPAKLQAMSDVEVLAAFMRMSMERAGGVRIERVEVVGGVAEGADLYHAITRTTVRLVQNDTRFTAMDVASLVRVDGRWWLQLNGDARKMMQMFEQAKRRAGAPAAPSAAPPGRQPAAPGLERLRQDRLRADDASKTTAPAGQAKAEQSVPVQD